MTAGERIDEEAKRSAIRAGEADYWDGVSRSDSGHRCGEVLTAWLVGWDNAHAIDEHERTPPFGTRAYA